MSALDDALLDELALRSRLNALVHERSEARQEAERLRVRAGAAGADPDLGALAERWEAVVARVGTELEHQRSRLREQEALVARLRAEAGGA
ncbi:hypothetical protein [Conexibacter sp. SYSU D00693]|uniref:hypothetical protein n=1 Tax=Conexibacter sp. SYSU D00693 TaxID=2812560 RepID=UPI00196AFBA3|nr:hypothetical protein [Conexibacter sp. SYSU D00693]